MARREICGVTIAWLSWVSLAWGQVVQLPTRHAFSVGTTVVVPDRGTAFLGGVSRASYGSIEQGTPLLGQVPGAGRLFRNRVAGASVLAADASVTATIIDHQQLDEAVLREAARRRAYADTDARLDRKAAYIARHVDHRPPLTAGTEPFPRRNEPANLPPGEDAATWSEAGLCFEMARQAEAAGRWGAARIQYHRAARLSQGELRDKALARLVALRSPAGPPKQGVRPAS